MAKTSATKLATNARYEATQRKFAIRVPLKDAEQNEKAASNAGQSVNAYVVQAIRDRMARETDT